MKREEAKSPLHQLTPFVLSGRIRTKVLMRIAERPCNPSSLTKMIHKATRPSISRVLKDLEEKGLINKMVISNSRLHFFNLTENGKKVVDNIKEHEFEAFF